MKEFTVSVRKLTDESLMREACEMTFLGESHQSLLSIYKSEHSPARTQLFWITFKNIPLASATHLLRHHVGSVPFQLTCREDRNGGNPGLPKSVDEIVNKIEVLQSMYHAGGNCLDEVNAVIRWLIDKVEWLKENTDRQTPVNLGILVNAQSLMDMAKLRLCNQAHKETIAIFQELKQQMQVIDPELASMMVRKCVYRNGLCGEPRCCGYNCTPAFHTELQKYRNNFSNKQMGIKSRF